MFAVSIEGNSNGADDPVQDVNLELAYSISPGQDVVGIGAVAGKSVLNKSGYLGLSLTLGLDLVMERGNGAKTINNLFPSECR